MKIIGHDTWVVRIPDEANRARTHIVLQVNTDEGTDRNMTRRRPACGEAQPNEMTNDAGIDGET